MCLISLCFPVFITDIKILFHSKQNKNCYFIIVSVIAADARLSLAFKQVDGIHINGSKYAKQQCFIYKQNHINKRSSRSIYGSCHCLFCLAVALVLMVFQVCTGNMHSSSRPMVWKCNCVVRRCVFFVCICTCVCVKWIYAI